MPRISLIIRLFFIFKVKSSSYYIPEGKVQSPRFTGSQAVISSTGNHSPNPSAWIKPFNPSPHFSLVPRHPTFYLGLRVCTSLSTNKVQVFEGRLIFRSSLSYYTVQEWVLYLNWISTTHKSSSWSFILVIIIAHHHQFCKYSAVWGTVKLGFDGVKYDYLDDISIVLLGNRLWYSLLNWHLNEGHIHKEGLIDNMWKHHYTLLPTHTHKIKSILIGIFLWTLYIS